MAASSGPSEDRASGAVLDLALGQVVQELGWDTDVDESLREQIMDAIDADLVYEPLEAVDVVLLWWRDGDGDLVDGLVDSLRDLSATGVLWLLTPKVGRPGQVEPADVSESALTAGLALANLASVSGAWQAQKLVRPKASSRR